MSHTMSPPACDEIEVSVFGPGSGESILVHLGEGDWIAIDSCINTQTKVPMSIEYLRQIGVQPEQIKLVVATHWHDDHIKGLSEILDFASSALFSLSPIVLKEGIISLLGLQRLSPRGQHRKVSELLKIVTILDRRGGKCKMASQGMTLLNRQNAGRISASVKALSPSDAAVMALNDTIKQFLSQASSISPPSLNDASIAISVAVGSVSVLLGADLECKPTMGWTEVHQDWVDNGMLPVHEGIKIPHHGSLGAYALTTRAMLSDSAWAVVTPWRRGGDELPKQEGIDKIRENYPRNSHITARPNAVQASHPRPVQKDKSTGQ